MQSRRLLVDWMELEDETSSSSSEEEEEREYMGLNWKVLWGVYDWGEDEEASFWCSDDTDEYDGSIIAWNLFCRKTEDRNTRR